MKLTEAIKTLREEPEVEETPALSSDPNYPDVVKGIMFRAAKNAGTNWYGNIIKDIATATFNKKHSTDTPYPFRPSITNGASVRAGSQICFLKKSDALNWPDADNVSVSASVLEVVRVDINGEIPCYCEKSYLEQQKPEALNPVIKERMKKAAVRNPNEDPEMAAKTAAQTANKEAGDALRVQVEQLMQRKFGISKDPSYTWVDHYNIPKEKLFGNVVDEDDLRTGPQSGIYIFFDYKKSSIQLMVGGYLIKDKIKYPQALTDLIKANVNRGMVILARQAASIGTPRLKKPDMFALTAEMGEFSPMSWEFNTDQVIAHFQAPNPGQVINLKKADIEKIEQAIDKHLETQKKWTLTYYDKYKKVSEVINSAADAMVASTNQQYVKIRVDELGSK